MADGPSPLYLIARWPGKVLEELLLAPWTVHRVRESLTDLPARIDTLSEALDKTTGALDTLLPSLDAHLGEVGDTVQALSEDLTAFRKALEQLLPELAGLVGGMDDRFENVEKMVGELGDGVLGLIASIPGVRRTLAKGLGRPNNQCMVWLTLVGLGSYLAVTGAVRVALGRKWRGVRFVTMDPRDWTPTEWAAGLLGAGTVATLLAGLVAAAAGHPGPHLDLGWVVGLGGLAAMVGGVALMACAQLTMGPSWRVGVDRAVATDLVVTGPFRVVRNPIYTSMLIAAGGAVLLTPTAAVAAGWILGLLFIEWQVRVVEEPFLLQRHGGRYATWSMNAGRFVPGVGACRPPRASVTVAAPEPTS